MLVISLPPKSIRTSLDCFRKASLILLSLCQLLVSLKNKKQKFLGIFHLSPIRSISPFKIGTQAILGLYFCLAVLDEYSVNIELVRILNKKLNGLLMQQKLTFSKTDLTFEIFLCSLSGLIEISSACLLFHVIVPLSEAESKHVIKLQVKR